MIRGTVIHYYYYFDDPSPRLDPIDGSWSVAELRTPKVRRSCVHFASGTYLRA